ncbi:MAG: SurA N-terminal domain-containing protein [Rhizobiales bacterium]|nr:SurA N-terminal domain-containing protein [Hyphomicrobiales bacterium]
MTSAARFAVLAVIGFASALGILPALADNTIRVTVNDEPITSYDISQRLMLMKIAGEKGGEKAAIQQLIDETLELSDARARGIKVPDSRVDAAFASIAGRMKMNAAGLTKALASAGLQAESLKRRIRAQMAWGQLVDARSRFEVSVKSSDIAKALQAQGDPGKITNTEFTLQQIIFVVPKGSSAGYIAQRKREAENFRSRYTGCDGAVNQAKGLRDVAVKSLGRRTTDQLVGPDGKEVQQTPVGKTTRPAAGDQGVTLIAVCSTRKIDSNAAAVNQAEDKLSLEQSKNVGDEYLKKLRDKAVIKYR